MSYRGRHRRCSLVAVEGSKKRTRFVGEAAAATLPRPRSTIDDQSMRRGVGAATTTSSSKAPSAADGDDGVGSGGGAPDEKVPAPAAPLPVPPPPACPPPPPPPTPSPLRHYEIALSKLLLLLLHPLPRLVPDEEEAPRAPTTRTTTTGTESAAAAAAAAAPSSSSSSSLPCCVVDAPSLLPPPPPPETPPRVVYHSLPSFAAGRRRRRRTGSRRESNYVEQQQQPQQQRQRQQEEKDQDPRAPTNKAGPCLLPRTIPELSSSSSSRDEARGVGGGHGPAPEEGQIVDPTRAAAKEDQVRSVLHCLDYVLRRSHSNNDGSGSSSSSNSSSSSSSSSSNHRNNDRNNTSDAAPRQRGGKGRRITLVDMGGGSGHLAIPATLRHPTHRVVVVDLNRRSIDLMKVKAAAAAASAAASRRAAAVVDGDDEDAANQQRQRLDDDDRFLASHPWLPLETTEIPNLYALCGSIEQFLLGADDEEEERALKFEVGLALHVCGQSTDVAIRACTQQQAALVAAPCCVGKMSTARHNPYVWQATNSNTSAIQYPQSKLYKELLLRDSPNNKDSNDNGNDSSADEHSMSMWWNALASAADDSTRHGEATARRWGRAPAPPPAGSEDEGDATDRGDPPWSSNPTPETDLPPPIRAGSSDMNHRRRSCCRAAKILVEWDRCLFLRERGYETLLTRMVPLSASPKHDIIVAIPPSWTKTTTQRTSSGGSSGGGVDGMLDNTDDERSDEPSLVVDPDAVKDLARTREYLRAATSGCGRCIQGVADLSQAPKRSPVGGDDDDDEISNGAWSRGEVAEVRHLLVTYFALSDARDSAAEVAAHGRQQDGDVYYFPTGTGRGRRKLVHYVAGTLGLEHWSHGKKQGTGKTVAVALPGTRRRLQSSIS
jgi:Methyltransferase domain